jgi:hypothetical protein
MKRAWSSITSERTRIKREELADQISRIQDERLRDSLRQAMTTLFVSIEADLEQETGKCRT